MLNLKIFCNVYIFDLITSLLKDISAVLGEISHRSHPGVKGLIWEAGLFLLKAFRVFMMYYSFQKFIARILIFITNIEKIWIQQ